MNRLIRFIRYDNAIPLSAIGLVFFAGGVFAASPEARETLIASEEQVISVDNSYLLNKDLSAFKPTVQVTGVTEDETDYYVAYTLATIGLEDSVWRDITKTDVLKVNKDVLRGRDLGLFVSDELKELLESELAYLTETQDFEKRKGETPKAVATAYSGLIGKLLDPTVEVFEGYEPVIPEPEAAPIEPGVAAVAEAVNALAGEDTTGTVALSLIGDNPLTITVGSTYAEPGAQASGGTGEYGPITTVVNGVEELLGQTTINTSSPGNITITYRVTDSAKAVSFATRTIIISEVTSTPTGSESSSESAVPDSTTPEEPTPTATSETAPNTLTQPAEVPAEPAPSEGSQNETPPGSSETNTEPAP